jgi:hypothetical protein
MGSVVAPSVLVPSDQDGVFGRFDLVALCGCHTLNVCLFVCIDVAMAMSKSSMGIKLGFSWHMCAVRS